MNVLTLIHRNDICDPEYPIYHSMNGIDSSAAQLVDRLHRLQDLHDSTIDHQLDGETDRTAEEYGESISARESGWEIPVPEGLEVETALSELEASLHDTDIGKCRLSNLGEDGLISWRKELTNDLDSWVDDPVETSKSSLSMGICATVAVVGSIGLAWLLSRLSQPQSLSSMNREQ